MKKIALIDICNTLADVNGELDKLLGKSDPNTYYHKGVTKNTFRDNPHLFSEAEVIKGSVEGVGKLSERYEIVYLTARPRWSKKITKDWLRKNGFPEGKIIFSNDKATVAKRLNAEIAIDDAPFEVNALSEVVPKVLVHRQSYNLSLSNLGIIFGWQEFNMAFA